MASVSASKVDVKEYVGGMLRRLCEDYDAHISGVVKEIGARGKHMGREVAGKELLKELTRVVKGEGEGSSSGPRIDQARVNALKLCARLQKVQAVIIPLKQVEDLVDRCIQPFVRGVKKQIAQDRDVELAVKMLPSLKSLGEINKHVGSSIRFKRSFNLTEQMTCLPSQRPASQDDQPRPKRRKGSGPLDCGDDLSPGPPVLQASDVRLAPIVPIVPPVGALVKERSAEMTHKPGSTTLSKDIHMLVSPTPPGGVSDSWQPQSPNRSSTAEQRQHLVKKYISASPGKDARYDLFRFARDVCNYTGMPNNATSASFYYLHFFLAHAVFEPSPPESAVEAVAAARALLEKKIIALSATKKYLVASTHDDWYTSLINGAYVDTDDTSPIPSGLLRSTAEAYIGALPSDELCALALAAIHLGAKSRDLPQRISSLLEAGRRSAIKRKWPPALPWRDHILLAEHRFLKALCFDLRIDDAQDLLNTFCPDAPSQSCYLYANEIKAEEEEGVEHFSLAMPPPIPPSIPYALDPKLKEDTIDKVLYTPAFEASGIVLEHEPKELIAAAVFCVWNHISKNLPSVAKNADAGIKDAWLAAMFPNPRQQTMVIPATTTKKKRTMNPKEVKIRGIVGELDATNSELKARFSDQAVRTRFEARFDAVAIRRARYNTALRAAHSALARLPEDEIARFVTRRSQDYISPDPRPIAEKASTELSHTDAPVDLSNRSVLISLAERPTSTRRRRDDECGVLLYSADDTFLLDMARRYGNEIELFVFPFRREDVHFRQKIFDLKNENNNNTKPCCGHPPLLTVGKKCIIPAVEPEFGGDDDDGSAEERASGLPRHFTPVLHVFWPKTDIETLKLSQRAKDAIRSRTKQLENALRTEYQLRSVRALSPPRPVVVKTEAADRRSNSTPIVTENSMHYGRSGHRTSNGHGKQDRPEATDRNGRDTDRRYRSEGGRIDNRAAGASRHYTGRSDDYERSHHREREYRGRRDNISDFQEERRSRSRSESRQPRHRDDDARSRDAYFRTEIYRDHARTGRDHYDRSRPYRQPQRRDDEDFPRDRSNESPRRADHRQTHLQRIYFDTPKMRKLFSGLDDRAWSDFNAITDFALRGIIIDEFQRLRSNLNNPSAWLSMKCKESSQGALPRHHGSLSPQRRPYRAAGSSRY